MFRVAVVCEGPTDRAIVEAILDHYLDDYEPLAIQPPVSAIGGDSGAFGAGWKGVMSWCKYEVSARGGLGQVAILQNVDLLVLQVDADVATDAEIACASPCPPPSGNADAVRNLVQNWLGLGQLPEKVILCVPSMCSETWAMTALFSTKDIKNVTSNSTAPGVCVECRRDVKALLRTLSRDFRPKLVVSQSGYLKNQAQGYRKVTQRMTKGWHNAIRVCGEANRFDVEVRAAIALQQG